MAHLREFLPVIHALGIRKFAVILWNEISKDQLTTQAAAVAYAWLFAVFPFLLFLLTLFAYIPREKMATAQDYISSAVNRVLAPDAADTIVTNLNEVLSQPRSGLLSIGLIVTLWIASGGMAMTMSALDAAYDNKKSHPFYIQRPIAMLLTIIITVLNLVVLLLLPVGTAIEKYLAEYRLVPAYVLWILSFARYGTGHSADAVHPVAPLHLRHAGPPSPHLLQPRRDLHTSGLDRARRSLPLLCR